MAFLNKRIERKTYHLIGLFLYKGEKMVEHGLYIIKKEFLALIHSLGGKCDIANGDKRPMYCCIKDNRVEGLYWVIPTSDISYRSDLQKENITLIREYLTLEIV